MTALDFSPTALAKGRAAAETAGVELAWTVADLTDHAPEPDAYDLVLIAYLHLPEPAFRTVLSRAAAALAPGGTLLAVGHDATNLDPGAGGPQDPAILYTPETVTGALGALRVERAERVRRPVDGDARPAIDTLVIATRA